MQKTGNDRATVGSESTYLSSARPPDVLIDPATRHHRRPGGGYGFVLSDAQLPRAVGA
jgi:hypothetical protein